MSDARLAAKAAASAATQPRRLWVNFAYLLPMCLAASTTLNWFRPGYFVAAGDINPFVRTGLSSELGSLWNHQLSGAGSPSYDVARLFDVIVLESVGFVGGSPATAQHVFMAIVMAFASFGSVYFGRSFTTSLPAVAAVGVLGPINPFVLVLIPNPLFVMMIGAAGVLGGLVVRSSTSVAPHPAVFALAVLPISYLSVNPPLLAMLTLWIVGLAAASGLHSKESSFGTTGRYLLKAAPLAIATSLWWLVPLGLTLFGGSESVKVAAQTDAAAWSWSHVDNSLLNVASLKAHWGWAHPEYYPYAAALDAGIWPLLRMLFPILSVAALVLGRREQRRSVATFVMSALLLILVAKGIHQPFQSANLWLYEHLPGFWLLREPMSKVGPFLVLLYVALTAITLAGAIERLKAKPQRFGRLGLGVLSLVVFGAAMAPQPLWSGGVISTDRAPLPSSHVKIPVGWQDAADFVNQTPATGKSILLPLNSYYQVTTNWGYHGVDSVFDQLTNRPTLQRLPGGYFSPPDGVDFLMASLEQRLIDGDAAAVEPLLRSLGVNNLVFRFDLGPSSAPNADQVEKMVTTAEAALQSAPDLANDVAAIFFVRDAQQVRVLNTPIGTWSGDAPEGAPLASLPPNAAAVDLAQPVSGIIWEPEAASDSIEFTMDEGRTLEAKTGFSDKPLRITSRTETSLTLATNDSIEVDGRTLFEPLRLAFDLNGNDVVALLGDNEDSPYLLASTDSFAFDPGEGVQALIPVGDSLLGQFGAPENCARSDDRSGAALGHIASASGTTVSLQAKAHSACIWAPVEITDGLMYVEFEYKDNGVRPPRICLWQEGVETCASTAALQSASEWTTHAALLDVDPAATAARLFLYADGSDTGVATEVSYRNLKVNKVQQTATSQVSNPGTASVDLAAGPHVLSIAGTSRTIAADQFNDLEDCGRFDDRSAEAVGLEVAPIDGGVSLRANAHSACVWVPVPLPQSDAVRLKFDYRTLSGGAARVCLWQEGPNQCAPLESLTTSTEWTSVQALALPDPATTELKLFLYADGLDTGEPTWTEYRNISSEETEKTQISMMPETLSEPLPDLTWRRESSSKYEIDVSAVDSEFILALNDAAATGWALNNLPDDWNAEPMIVDGYATAWRINGTGSATLIAEFAPDRYANLAIKISLATVLGLLILLGAMRVRRGRIQRHTLFRRDRRAVSLPVED